MPTLNVPVSVRTVDGSWALGMGHRCHRISPMAPEHYWPNLVFAKGILGSRARRQEGRSFDGNHCSCWFGQEGWYFHEKAAAPAVDVHQDGA